MMSKLPLPASLVQLMADGLWPMSHAEACRQNGAFRPGAGMLENLSVMFLEPPPFYTVGDHLRGTHPEFWLSSGRLDQIDPDLTLLIGDVGAGTDTAIALDYRSPSAPSVIWLKWVGHRSEWQRVCDRFDVLAASLRSRPGA